MRTAFDAAYPPATVPGTATTACIYAGGDTPNPITDPLTVPVYTKVRYWLPGWVCSNPTPTLARSDAQAICAWLKVHKAPAGIATFLDLETAVTVAYVSAYTNVMHTAGFKVLPYGSRSTLSQNPIGDGYFLADPTWRPQLSLPSNVVAIQWKYTGGYDLSAISTAVPLWDTKGAPVPTPTPTSTASPSSEKRQSVLVGVRSGNGWVLTTIPWSVFMGVTLEGSDPGVDGGYWLGEVAAQERTGRVLVTVTRSTPADTTRKVFIATS
jgi:hypothetical protein